MKRGSRLSIRATALFTAWFLLALAGLARAGDTAQLSGTWNLNPDQSDDTQQKVQQVQADSQRGNSGAYPGGNSYPGAGGGYPGSGGYPGGGGMGRGGMGGGGMGRGGMGNPSGGVSGQEWAQLAANPQFLNIRQHDNQIVITDSDYTRTLYPDSKKHKATDEDGNKISTKTAWQSGKLVAETKMGSGKLGETFQTSSDGKQLIVVSHYENSSLSEPLNIRRVYDLGNAAH
jgi:hypothetical protein